jgi:hypothetical protein
VLVDDGVLLALDKLRQGLQEELGKIVERRSRLEIEGELEALDAEIKSKQRALELVEATERQLAGQVGGQPGVEGGGPGASTQVRNSASMLHAVPA